MAFSFQEHYKPGDSPLHQLDPRVKVVTAVLLIVGIVLTPEHSYPAYPLLWALLASLAAIGGIGALRLGQNAALVLPFSLAALTLTFTLPGEPVARILGLTITDAGLARFVTILLKSWLAAQAALLLAMTTPFIDLLWALNQLYVPSILVAIIALTYRYLFSLQDEAQRLIQARTARSGTRAGQKPGGSLRWRAKVAGGMIGTLFVRSYERSERVYLAMRARGYTGHMRILHASSITRRDILYGAVPVAVLIVIEISAMTLWHI